MLSNKLRLKGKSNFSDVRVRGTLFQGKFVGISKLKIGNSEPTLVGVVVSTKISKKAVVRNKIRRAIYDGFGSCYHHLPPGYNIVIMAKRNSSIENYQKIRDDVASTLLKFM